MKPKNAKSKNQHDPSDQTGLVAGTELLHHMPRRAFLGLTGTAAGVALLQGCAKRETVLIEQSLKRSSTNPGEASWRRSICQQCAGGCEVQVRMIDGRAKKIEGDPTSPVNSGGVCALGHSALQELYHPNRILHPQRTAGSAESTVEASSWEDALAAIGPIFKSAGGTGAIAVCCGPDPVERAMVEHLASALDATVCVVESAHAAVEREAQRRFFGGEVELLQSLADADLILAVGASILDRWGNPVAQALGVAEARARGAQLAVISERMSLTAAKADLWLPVRGGTQPLVDALVALAEGSSGAVDLAVLASQLDVPSERLERLAELLAAAEHPAILVGGEGATVEDVMAGHRLQSAYGVLPRAVRADRLLGNVADPRTGPSTGPSTGPLRQLSLKELTARVADGSVRVVITIGVDLLGAVPQSWGLADSLSSNSSSALIALATANDATTRAADWILPMQTDLERVQVSLTRYGQEAAALVVADPLVEARGESRHPVDIVLAMIAASGQDAGWEDASAAREAMVAAIGDLGGKTASGVVRSAVRGDGRVPLLGDALPTVSALNADGALAVQHAEGDGSLESRGPSTGDRTQLTLFEGVRGERSGWGRPWLAELPDPISSVMWGSWIDLDPHAANELGVSTGDLVTVKSAYGATSTTVFINPATRPGTASMPLGAFDPSVPGDGDPRNLLGPEDVAGAPSQRVMVVVKVAGDSKNKPSPIFGRGLHAAEQIPAGWKGHGAATAEPGKQLIVIGNGPSGETHD